jgi:hypothetical protein
LIKLHGHSFLLCFLLVEPLIIRCIIKHNKSLFFRRIFDCSRLLLLVERHFTYDLVKSNGALFIFIFFTVHLLLSNFWFSVVEMLFGVFLWVSSHSCHINWVQTLKVTHLFDSWHREVTRTWTYTIVHVKVSIIRCQIFRTFLLRTLIIYIIICTCPVQSWNLFFQKSLNITIVFCWRQFVVVRSFEFFLGKQKANNTLILFFWWIILALIIAFVCLGKRVMQGKGLTWFRLKLKFCAFYRSHFQCLNWFLLYVIKFIFFV